MRHRLEQSSSRGTAVDPTTGRRKLAASTTPAPVPQQPPSLEGTTTGASGKTRSKKSRKPKGTNGEKPAAT